MDFRLSSEQTMLRDAARTFVAERLGFDQRKGKPAAPSGEWTQMAELGWFMLLVPEDCGGLSGGAADIALIAEELGRGLAMEPFVEAAVVPSQLLNFAGSDVQRQATLPDLASGATRWAAALYEPRRGFDLAPRHVQALPCKGGWRLSGAKVGIDGGREAHRLIVSAALSGQSSLFVVDAAVQGVKRVDYDAIDGRVLSDFTFTDVLVETSDHLAAAADVDGVIARTIDTAIVVQCAEALGCINEAIELTINHLQVRQQFGKALATFQALQHGMANLFIEANDAQSMIYRALAMLDATAAERTRATSACKVKVMEAARSVVGTCVHYHGGIGVTTEYSVGNLLRRVLLLDQRFGNGLFHLERLMEA
jgi:acyl-CoA dehydrogenase